MTLYHLLRPLLFALPPETAHELTMRLLRVGQGAAVPLLRLLARPPLSMLRQELLGLRFAAPLGLAAGLDKNAELVPLWRALGFGLVEVGSVSARAAVGNPRPRIFRWPAERALLNRMGLPNQGAAAVAARLRGLRVPGAAPLGVNLAKTHDPLILGDAAIADFCHSYEVLAPLGDYVVINVSCPNTSDGKTFEEPAALARLLAALPAVAPRPPLLLKLGPPAVAGVDAGRLAEILAVARGQGVAGFVLGNTARDPAGRGGLSGPPLRGRQVALLRHVFRATRAQGWAPVLIGVGGVDSVAAAYERVRAGAALLQVYTGLIYEGPGLVGRVHRGLAQALQRDGFARLTDAVGVDT